MIILYNKNILSNRLIYLRKLLRRKDINIHKLEPDIYKYISLAHSWSYIRYIRRLYTYIKYNNIKVKISSNNYISRYKYESSLYSIQALLDSFYINDHIFIPTVVPGHGAGYYNINKEFSIYNFSAIAALYYRKKYKKILILDLDIHNGVGTIDIIKNKKNIYYISLFSKISCNIKYNYNNVYNFLLDPGIDNNIYIKLFENHVISLINSIDPDIIITSLGFDAHKDDKYSSINIDFDVYNYIFSYLRSFDKILYILEGGYNKEIIYNGTKLLLKNG
ncbi:acetylpolyamine amidohydrolase [Nanobdella aerobiophila]|uniref:Acetylpolyamine amidohydrolase n=1 Tax=Nanobdella aerobiophila TaxID=2586965 RepID=A0A915SA82_9ARCH|nr:hypothetical protein [Nanobdella aerobiophila]BBL45577.1 acetylpolyamine amidohydrolase [Nanobdella aerobiophila]